jgi:O-antigen/teichoic acid export membrane protein
MQDLKAKTIRGGLARLCAQGASFVLRVGSLIVLAPLLSPKDFGVGGDSHSRHRGFEVVS